MFIRVQLRYPPLPMQILPASGQKSLLLSRWEKNPTYPLPSTPSTPDTTIPSLVVRKRWRLDMDALLLQRGSVESLDPWRCSMLTHHTMAMAMPFKYLTWAKAPSEDHSQDGCDKSRISLAQSHSVDSKTYQQRMTTSKFQRWFEALTCNIIHASILKNYTMSSHSKSASFLTPDPELFWGSPENFPKLLVPGPYWVASITSRPSQVAREMDVVDPNNTIFQIPSTKHQTKKIQVTEKKRVLENSIYRSSSNSSKKLQKNLRWLNSSWKYKRPLGRAGEDVEGFLGGGQKTWRRGTPFLARLETVSLGEKVCSLDSM